MKRILSVLLTAVLMLSLCSCGGKKETDGKIKIIATVFPAYDFVKQIVKQSERFEVSLLSDNHADLHSFQPSADDIINIMSADLFVFVGGSSDMWTSDVFQNSENGGENSLNLMSAIGSRAKDEELKEGMQADGDEESELDEHIWLSLKNAQMIVNAIAEKIVELDGQNAEAYIANAEAYCQKLHELDLKYGEAVNEAKVKTLLFADRFPFRYLVDDYSLDYYAAFSGCSAESEVSPETITFLSGKLDSENIGAIIILDGTDDKMAQTVRDSSKNKSQKILRLDSMQSASTKDGMSYLETMQNNLEVLKEALR